MVTITEEKNVTINYILYPEEKYAICEACNWFRSSVRQCKKCLCFMPLKVQIKGQRCPLRKW
tara:strand:+ start:79 stop:264 length:186 start_codon:yes stop_codon:yes gene_type:complete